MMRLEILDFDVYVEGKKRASFENVGDAQYFARVIVEDGAEVADVINAFTGEVLHHFYEHCTREVREGF